MTSALLLRSTTSLLTALLPLRALGLDCAGLPPADFTVCETLQNGSSATEIHGGTFNGVGFVMSAWESWLHWDLPKPMAQGSVEWTVDGLTQDTWQGDNVFLLQMYDKGGHWGADYGLELRSYGPVADASYLGKLKLKVWAPGKGTYENLVPNPGWDGSPHTFRLEFDPAHIRLWMDGGLIYDYDMTGWSWFANHVDLPCKEWVAGYSGPLNVTIHDLTMLMNETLVIPPAPAATCPAGLTALPLVADTTAASYAPDTVWTDVADLAVDGPGGEVSFLTFDAGAAAGVVTQATLLLHTRTSASAGGTGASVRATASGWTEETLTWSNHPAYGDAEVGSTGPVEQGTDVAVVLSGGVTAGALVSFALVGGDNGTHFSSAEDTDGVAPTLCAAWAPEPPPPEDLGPPPPPEDLGPPPPPEDVSGPVEEDTAVIPPTGDVVAPVEDAAPPPAEDATATDSGPVGVGGLPDSSGTKVPHAEVLSSTGCATSNGTPMPALTFALMLLLIRLRVRRR